MKAAIYTRVSTTDQKCEMQLAELREYVLRRAWELAGEHVDTGWSGAKASRPEFDRLMRDASQRKLDVILLLEAGSVWALLASLQIRSTATTDIRCSLYGNEPEHRYGRIKSCFPRAVAVVVAG
jgi:hypothetical protein